jgi:hypothetical protein
VLHCALLRYVVLCLLVVCYVLLRNVVAYLFVPCHNALRLRGMLRCLLQGYDMKTYTVKITLQPDCGCVTGMVEIPGTFCRFLITSHADGSLCLWDLKRQKLFRVGVRRSRCARVGVWL